jgi:hypothetical protein
MGFSPPYIHASSSFSMAVVWDLTGIIEKKYTSWIKKYRRSMRLKNTFETN